MATVTATPAAPAAAQPLQVPQVPPKQTRLFAGDVRAHFALGRTIGRGSFGKVKTAVARRPLELERGRAAIAEGAPVAVKLVDATGWNATQYDEFYRECFLLAQVDHPNVVRLIAVYKNARKSGRVEFAMVTELATGGELFDRIQRVGRFSERAASGVIRKMLGALAYLHARGIAHRDIKPENVVFATGAKGAEVKLIDFGFAQMRDVQGGRDARFATRLGSPNYVAPEILLGQRYDERCDVWSLGVMLFVMLCGSFPFSPDAQMSGDDAHMSVYRKIVHGRIEWVESEWTHVSAPARQLVRAMLTVEYTRRPTAAECLRHPWIAVRSVPSKESFPAVARENFGRFNAARHSSRRVSMGSASAFAGFDATVVPSSAGREDLRPRARFVRAARCAVAALRVADRRASVADVTLLAMCAERRHTVAALPGGLLRSLVDSKYLTSTPSRDYFSDFATDMDTETEDEWVREAARARGARGTRGRAVEAAGAATTAARPVLAERIIAEEPMGGGGGGGGLGGFGRALRGLRNAAGRAARGGT